MQTFQNPPPPQPRFFHMPRFNSNFQKTNNYFNLHQYKQHLQQGQNVEFDGKRLRKAVVRKTIDYNSAIIKQLQARVWQRDFRDQPALQPDCSYYTELVPPIHVQHNPINAVTTKFVRTSTNKMRCPIFCVAWTPEGRRLVTGASSGEFTLWNGLTFNFETILQAHDSPVRCMVWSHNDMWMVTGDHSGYVKYWQSNMNNVKMFQSHKEALRGISFCPTDQKFATCSDDGTVRVWDFLRCHEEKILRGHGADVKCVDWHPQKGLIVSGSKDSQQPIKLWDPKNGQSIATLHAHKSTVMEVRWNQNGNWMLTASRDHLVKMFDIRNLNQDVQTFRGHKKEVCSLAWHPAHESLFTSGGSDGSVMFWVVGADKEVGAMEQAHDSIVWSLAWHPLGHILCSGSNDHSSKFWTRNRPGDKMRDKYNLNVLPSGGPADEAPEYDEPSSGYIIPGMGLDQSLSEHNRSMDQEVENDMEASVIPGLDFGSDSQNMYSDKPSAQKKVPYAKPIPRQFQQQWLENKRPLLAAPPKDVSSTGELGPNNEPLQNPSDIGSPHINDTRIDPRMDPRNVDPRGVDPRSVDPRSVDPRGVEPRGIDPRGLDQRGMDPRGMDPRGLDPRGADPRNADPRSTGMNQNAIHSRTQPSRGDDIDQRKFFPDQYSGGKRDYASAFGDNDFRQQDSRGYGGDRSISFVGNQQRPDDGGGNVRMYQDYDSRDFGPGGRGPPPPQRGSSNQQDCGPRDYGDCDLRVRDEDRRVPPSASDGDNSSYGSRKRGWDDGPNDQRPYYGSSRDDMYNDGYGDKSGGRGRNNNRGGRGRGSFRGRGRNARSYQ